jgi:transcriptional regulator with XRE-family HTH domain
MESFADVIAALHERGLSDGAIARDLGIDRSQVSRWRRGLGVPKPATLQKMTDVYGYSFDRLLRLCGYLAHQAPVADSRQPYPDAIPFAARARALDAAYERWMATMGPRMGFAQADEAYWRPILNRAEEQAGLAEMATGTRGPVPGGRRVAALKPARPPLQGPHGADSSSKLDKTLSPSAHPQHGWGDKARAAVALSEPACVPLAA